jgi:hypothetical protein
VLRPVVLFVFLFALLRQGSLSIHDCLASMHS